MARIRSIKPEFFESEDVAALPMRARLTWIGLWVHCDNYGRAKDNVKLVKKNIWPLDQVSLKDIEEDLTVLAEHGRIVRYEANGRPYMAVTNWHHQSIPRPGVPKHPAPPSDVPNVARHDSDGSVTAHVRVSDESVGNREQGTGNSALVMHASNSDDGEPPKKRNTGRKRPAKALPDDWQPTATHVAKAHELGVDGRREEEKFRAHAAANDRRQVDWNQAFTQWLLNARPGNVRPIQNGPKPKPRDSPEGPFQYRQARPGEENRLR